MGARVEVKLKSLHGSGDTINSAVIQMSWVFKCNESLQVVRKEVFLISFLLALVSVRWRRSNHTYYKL